jgi:LacI family transcriptional regulator
MAKAIYNLGDVAVKAGVSKSTVSRVLNNKLGNGFTVKEEVRDRVLEIAAKLNYRPNLIAQSLTNQSVRMIHVLGGHHALSDLGNIYQTVVNNITSVVDSAAKEFDVTVDVSTHKPDSSELPAWRIDGAIVLAWCTDVTKKELESRSMPYVVVNGPSGPSGSSVRPDDIGGTKLAVRHLVEIGHHKIAYAGPRKEHLSGHSSIFERHETYLKEMAECGLTPVVDHYEEFDSAEEFVELTVIRSGATAILAYGHMEGLNIMQAAHKLGIAVPERLSLICFCDEYANSVMSPGLTFIDLRSRDMGYMAASLLLKQLELGSDFKPEHINLDEKLVVRESTAPPSR